MHSSAATKITPPGRFDLQSQQGKIVGSLHGKSLGKSPSILALHGGGQSTRSGYDYLLAPLSQYGVCSVAADFLGHGESDIPAQSSIILRCEQAVAISKAIGFSAGGCLIATSLDAHIACRLLDVLKPSSVILFAPAAYPEAAESVPFGPAFRIMIQSNWSKESSPAFKALSSFSGNVVVIRGAEDEVIPLEIAQLYQLSAKQAGRYELFEFDGAPHAIHGWLRSHESERNAVLDVIRRMASYV